MGGLKVIRTQISNWLKKEEDTGFQPLSDLELAIYLNGLIVYRRGRREGSQSVAEKKLNNNIILRKLKIALELNDNDILQLLVHSGLSLSRHELSAFFRKPEHKNYRKCKDQVLRNFLMGMQLQYREKDASQVCSAWKK